nr:retrotransposon Orf1 [Tanacetum cinerariifolium]
QNKNPSSPKRVHFIDPVILLTKEDEPKEEDIIEPNATKGDDHSITVRTEEEVKEESEEFDEETKDGEEDDPEYFDTFATIEELSNHEWLLKNPRPSWVNAMVKMGNLDNIKISCMVGQFLKRQAYIDPKSPINVMSRLNYC